jgi:uncharacterized protein
LIKDSGFELGVHDLKHDGKLFNTKLKYLARACKINEYLNKWNAVGFRSGFMLHNLDWIKALAIAYDSSTFDTDPFEPQPTGVGTIFPFCIDRWDRSFYVELPYTLAQDHTLFCILQQKSIKLWKQKVDWIVEHEGMVLLNSHPDYMNFSNETQNHQRYPVKYYEELLEYIQSQYHDQFWHGSPRELAEYIGNIYESRRAPVSEPIPLAKNKNNSKNIWIDLDNTPHVLFFKPIIEKLEKKGYDLLLTARDAFQVCDLAEKSNMKFARIGRHYGKLKAAKVLGTLLRTVQLAVFIIGKKPLLAISHGSRAQTLLCKFRRIPTVLFADYEHSKGLPFVHPTYLVFPEVLKNIRQKTNSIIFYYPGIKENVYIPSFQPDPQFRNKLNLDENEIIVVVRPPANEAHYHNKESETLLLRLMEHLVAQPNVRIVMLPRNQKQTTSLLHHHQEWFENAKCIIPKEAIDGLNAIYHSDLVVSGGGTMNREAATIGVPVFSIFRGKIGNVDQHLCDNGKLVLIHSEAEIVQKIKPAKFIHNGNSIHTIDKTLDYVCNMIERIYFNHMDECINQK